MKRVDLKISLLLAFFCSVGGFFVVPYQLDSLKSMLPNEYELILETLPFPLPVLLILSAIQLFIITFIFAFLGIKIARKVNFKLPILDAIFTKQKVSFDRTAVLLSIIFGIITAFVLVASDRFFFQHKIELIAQSNPEFSFLGLLTGVFYGGIFEEILMRLFIMSLLVWIMSKIFKNLTSIHYWIAILIAAALFAAGHLPATETLFGELNGMLIIRSFLLNGIGGIFFGYLYWKKGFEYAVMSHGFTHISLQLIFIPLF